MCPAPRSSHTSSAHHPVPWPSNSDGPHPGTRGWAHRTAPLAQTPPSPCGGGEHPCGQLPPSNLQSTPCPPASWDRSGIAASKHSAARRDKQLTPRHCCPCAGVQRHDEWIGQCRRFRSSVRLLGHTPGSGIVGTSPRRQEAARLSRNQVLDLAGRRLRSKGAAGEEAVRGEQGSCAREAVDHHDRRPGTRIWPLGTSQSGARRAGRAL